MLFLWMEDADFRAFAFDSPLPAVAADILQSQKINLFSDQLLVKEPGSLERTPWHQDMGYWPLSGKQLCTIWVALDPVTVASGAMEYIKGSHTWGKLFKPIGFIDEGGKRTTRYDGLTWEECPDFDTRRKDFEFVHWDVEPGDCIIHHPLVVHGGGGNTRTDISRRALAPRFAGDDIVFAPTVDAPERRPSGLTPGQGLDCELYPRIWPRAGR